jgi:plastocyanin
MLAASLVAGAAVGVAAASTSAGSGLGPAPADVPPSSASFTAVDFSWNVTGSASTQADIAPGGTVTFSYPSGGYHHNADFGAGSQPTSCSQTAGAASGAVPPLPAAPTAAGWSGTCTFDTAGTYTFHCDMHPSMTATIVVGDTTPTTTTTTTTTTSDRTTATTTSNTSTTTATTGPTAPEPPPTTTTKTTTTTTPPPASPLAGPARIAIALPAIQHGTRVHGSVRLSAAGRGGRAQVSLLASGPALGITDVSGPLQVGRLTRRRLPPRRVTFSVPLDPIARRALERAGQLRLSVTVTVTSPKGARASLTRPVRMRS